MSGQERVLVEFIEAIKPALIYWENTPAGEDFLVRIGKWATDHPDLASAVQDALASRDETP